MKVIIIRLFSIFAREKKKIILTFAANFLLLSNLSMAQIHPVSELKRISLNRSDNKLEVQIEVYKLLTFKSFPLSNPNRLVIDFFLVNNFSCDPHLEVTDFGIKAIRAVKHQPDVTRVVFDLAKKPPSHRIRKTSKGLMVVFWFGKERKEKVAETILPQIQRKFSKEEKDPFLKLPPEIIENEYKMTFSIGLSSGFCFMHASRFQDVYGKSSLFTGAETVFRFPLREKEFLGVSLGFNFISDRGLTPYEKSKLEIIPITISAFYSRQYGIFFPYAGIGVDYYNYHENSPETFGDSPYSGKIWGVNIQAGTYVYLTSSLSLKLFFKYQHARLKEHGTEINMGGNAYGLALAFHFKIPI